MRLLGVELRRAYHRRANRVLVALLLVVFALVVVISLFTLDDIPKATPVSQDADTYQSANLGRFTDLYQRSTTNDEDLIVPAVMLAFFAALLSGATMGGADWKWNMYGPLLTWEPRRIRFLSTRFISCFIVGAIGVAFLTVAFAVFTIPIVLVHGTFSGLDSQWWSSALQLLLRIAILGGVVALGGAAVAMIGRSTTTALIVSAVYLLILQNVLMGLRPEWWYFAYGYLPFVVFDWNPVTFSEGVVVGVGNAIFALGGFMVVLVAFSLLLFKRRDVTAS